MTNLKVTAKDFDGVQFYVSDDGNTIGMSQQGLSKFCGISPNTVSSLMGQFSLNPLQVNAFAVSAQGKNNMTPAKLISAEDCVKIIEYMAFDSRNKSDTALYAYRRFAAIGFKTWVKQVVGFREPELEAPKTMREIVELGRIAIRLFEATEDMPGLQMQLEDLGVSVDDGSRKSASEFAEVIIGRQLTKSEKHKISLQVAQTYRNHYSTEPDQINAVMIKPSGKTYHKVFGYSETDRKLIEATLIVLGLF